MRRRLVRRVRSKLLQLVVVRLMVRHRNDDELVRLGSAYGGWWVPASLAGPRSTVVSGGVGEDTTFDEELLLRGCEVWAIDPTPRAAEHVRSRRLNGLAGDRFHFFPIGLWHRHEQLRFYAPSNPNHVSHSITNIQQTTTWFVAECFSVKDVMERASLDAIDLLKLDIEGAELEVLNHLLLSALRPRAICVELDAPLPELRTLRLLRKLKRSGYRLAHGERWNLLFVYTTRADNRWP